MNLGLGFHKEIVLKEIIDECQSRKHTQQVAYSTYHSCLTQICFTCMRIRTSIKQSEIVASTDKDGGGK